MLCASDGSVRYVPYTQTDCATCSTGQPFPPLRGRCWQGEGGKELRHEPWLGPGQRSAGCVSAVTASASTTFSGCTSCLSLQARFVAQLCSNSTKHSCDSPAVVTIPSCHIADMVSKPGGCKGQDTRCACRLIKINKTPKAAASPSLSAHCAPSRPTAETSAAL